MKYSNMIYNIYLKYVSSDDIFAYSVDEVFCDITEYLKYYKKDAKYVVEMMLDDVYKSTGITATAGIGTNMYLAKIAMDIVAKKIKPDKNGVRIAILDTKSYKEVLWDHAPLTDFWSIGLGTRRRLENNKMFTMGDVALCSINNEKLLYKLFGVQAELLIDHAWGYEPCTIKSVKSYKPTTKSLSLGQVLFSPYNTEKAKLIVKEMTELIVLDMVSKHYMTNLITLSIGYDVENLTNERTRRSYKGKVVMDHYGRYIPCPSHGSKRFEKRTSSTKTIMKSMLELFDEIINPLLTVRRINISVNNLKNENDCKNEVIYKQFDLFSDTLEIDNTKLKENNDVLSEHKLQNTVIDLKNKFGKNAILKAIDLEEGATTIIRNQIVGGHKG